MQQSITFKTLQYARAWAYCKNFENIMFLVYDRENKEYSFVNENKLFYLQNCWVADLQIIETWG